jgi:hypothetical protein
VRAALLFSCEKIKDIKIEKNGKVAWLHNITVRAHTTLIAFLLWKLLTFHHSINTASFSMF